MRRLQTLLSAAILVALAGCATQQAANPNRPAPLPPSPNGQAPAVSPTPPVAAPAPRPPASTAAVPAPDGPDAAGLPPDLTPSATPSPAPGLGPSWSRPRSRWVPVRWSELPGWSADRALDLWPALLRGCEKPAPAWQTLCIAASNLPPQTDGETRQWMQQYLQPYRVESPDGAQEGLITGYFEPLIQARRTPDAHFKVPLYGPPSDLGQRKPYWTRQQLETLPAARATLKGQELLYVADPMDALILQIQGSGRLQVTEGSGRRRWVRMAFAGHNDQPYKSVGRWLIEQGEMTPAQASWPAIKDWAQRHPQRVQEMLWVNPRMVFFREEALADPQLGPNGAQAVPLTPGRSIAVDPQSIPYGTPVWLDTTEPLSNTPLRRLVMAQDTGGAITGAVRADYFWGWGDNAEQQAGRMKQSLRLWALWPLLSRPVGASEEAVTARP